MIYNQTMFWFCQRHNENRTCNNNKHDKFTIRYWKQSSCFCVLLVSQTKEDHDEDFSSLWGRFAMKSRGKSWQNNFSRLSFASWILITKQLECAHVSQVPMPSYALTYITIPSRVFARFFRNLFLAENAAQTALLDRGGSASKRESRVRHCMFTSIPEEEKNCFMQSLKRSGIKYISW